MGVRAILAVVVLPVASAHAQPADSSSSEADGKKAATSDTAPPPADVGTKSIREGEDAAPKFAWEPFGYLRLQYLMVQNDPNIAFVGRDDGFELQNARVGVRGTYGKRAKFVVSIDGAVDERAQINVPEGKLRVGLRDAYADVAVQGKLDAR